MEEQDTYRRTEIDEEKSRDRKQSGTTEGSKEQKTAKGEHTAKRGTRGKEEERKRRRGRSPEQSREAGDSPLAAFREEKKRRRGPRSVLPVRIPTGSPVLAIQTKWRRRTRRKRRRTSTRKRRRWREGR